MKDLQIRSLVLSALTYNKKDLRNILLSHCTLSDLLSELLFLSRVLLQTPKYSCFCIILKKVKNFKTTKTQQEKTNTFE